MSGTRLSSGACLRVAVVAAWAAAAEPARPRTYVSRLDYGLRGALVGGGVAVALPVVTVLAGDGDCMCGIELPTTVPVFAALGMFAGAAVWDIRYEERLPTRQPTPEELAPSPGLARYMAIGALAGGGLGAARSFDRCDDCTVGRGLVQNVPVGAAVGAIGGAVVYGVRHRGGR